MEYVEYMWSICGVLTEVDGGGRNLHNHESFAVAPQAILQQMRQLGVTIRYMSRFLSEGLDDVS